MDSKPEGATRRSFIQLPLAAGLAAGLPMGLYTPRAEAGFVAVVGLLALRFFGFLTLIDLIQAGNKGAEYRAGRSGAYDPMGAPGGSDALWLGDEVAKFDERTRLRAPEYAYLDMKARERSPYLYPASERQRVSMSDREFFEAALRRRMGEHAYARDWRDESGGERRIVAATTRDGTYIAENCRGVIEAYKLQARLV